jgi:hypothetical protein
MEVLARARELRAASRRLIASCDYLRHHRLFVRCRVHRLKERSADLLTVSLFQRGKFCLVGELTPNSQTSSPRLCLLA